MMKFLEVSSVLDDFWALLIRASGLTMRQPRIAFPACSSARGPIGGEVSAEFQQGRAENGNAPSEFIARRKFSLHSPPTFFSSRYHQPRPFGRDTDATEEILGASSLGNVVGARPHRAPTSGLTGNVAALRAVVKGEGERPHRSPLDLVNPAWGSERQRADGVSRAARRASEAHGDPDAFPGLNPVRALDVNGKAAGSNPKRGGERALTDARRAHNLASLDARPYLLTSPNRAPATNRRANASGRFGTLADTGIGCERLFAPLYAMQAVTCQFQPKNAGLIGNGAERRHVEEFNGSNRKIDGGVQGRSRRLKISQRTGVGRMDLQGLRTALGVGPDLIADEKNIRRTWGHR